MVRKGVRRAMVVTVAVVSVWVTMGEACGFPWVGQRSCCRWVGDKSPLFPFLLSVLRVPNIALSASDQFRSPRGRRQAEREAVLEVFMRKGAVQGGQ